MEMAIWVWLALAFIFVIIEVFAPGFIFACFVAGSIAGGITSLFSESLVLQAVIFAVVSLILIPLTRPLAAKITKPSPVDSNVDALIGQTGIVKKVVSSVEGQITVDNQVWQARCDNEISVGKKIKVLEVNGTKLLVEEAV